MIDPSREMDALNYVAERTKISVESYEPCTSVAIVDSKGKLIGGFVFREYRGHSVEISGAFEPDREKGHIKESWDFVWDYVFNQLGCARATALIRRGNKESRRLTEGMGFKLEGKLRRGFDGKQDLMVYGLLREECEALHGIR